MKIHFSFFRAILCAGLIALCSSGYGQCYRVYIKMYADYTYYQLNGSNVAATEAAMRATLTSGMLNMYQYMGVEFVVLPPKVFTKNSASNPNDAALDPFRNATDTTAVDNVMLQKLPNTYGGGASESPFHPSNNKPGFTYNINLVFFDKPIRHTPNGLQRNLLIGKVIKIGDLYSNEAHAWVTKKSMRVILRPLPNPGPNGETLYEEVNETTVVTNAQHERSVAHEIGHLFGARHDEETSALICSGASRPIMCTNSTGYTLSPKSVSTIENLLKSKHFDESSNSLSLSNLTWTSSRAYNAVTSMSLTSNFLAKNGPVYMKSKSRISVRGTAKLSAQSNDAIALIIDPNIYDCSAKNSGSNLRNATPEEIAAFADHAQEEFSEGRMTITPNPSTGMATVTFYQEKQGKIRLTVHNLLGQVVKDIAPDNEFLPGQHEIGLDLSSQMKGVYLVNFSSNNQSAKVRVVLK